MIAHGLNNAIWVGLSVTQSEYEVGVLQGLLSLALVVLVAVWAGKPSVVLTSD